MKHHYILYGLCAALIAWNLFLHFKVKAIFLFHNTYAKFKMAGVDLFDMIAKAEKGCFSKCNQDPSGAPKPPTSG